MFTNIGFLEIVFFVFLSAIFIQFIYYVVVYRKFFSKKPEKPDAGKNNFPVSIVIPAKDEYHNLIKNLPLFLEQDYEDFEIVVVDDGSVDETPHLLRELAIKHSRLKVITINENKNFFRGKKFPLSIGIKSAKHEVLLLTDADCKPMSNQWLKNMVQAFNNPQTEIVLGYGAYETRKGLMNKIIRYDTISIAIQYFSFALAGKPYMGVGRNLAYRKSLFYKHKGFTSHLKLMSGDDDLFVNMAATKSNTACEYHESSHTLSAPKLSFASWVRQKKRHFTSGAFYKFQHQFLIGLFSFTKLIVYITAALLLSYMFMPEYSASIFGIYILLHVFTFKRAMVILHERDLIFFSLFFDIFFVLFNPILLFLNFVSKPSKWK